MIEMRLSPLFSLTALCFSKRIGLILSSQQPLIRKDEWRCSREICALVNDFIYLLGKKHMLLSDLSKSEAITFWIVILFWSPTNGGLLQVRYAPEEKNKK